MTDQRFKELAFMQIENTTKIPQDKYVVVWQVKSLNTRKMIVAIIGEESDYGDFIEVSSNEEKNQFFIDFYKKQLQVSLVE